MLLIVLIVLSAKYSLRCFRNASNSTSPYLYLCLPKSKISSTITLVQYTTLVSIYEKLLPVWS